MICAGNASALTGAGTNSYILGSGQVAVIDPGPADDRHLAAILAALDTGERISHIIVTHPHLDHSALAPRLAAATGAPVYAFGRATDGRSPLMQRLADLGLSDGGEGLDHAFAPDLYLADGDTVGGPDWQLAALHTPGHLGSHICLDAGDWLFSGDHVMGWSSSVVSPPDGDMGAYVAALHRLSQGRWSRFLPGHGAAIETPLDRVAELIAHRALREREIHATLTRAPASPRAIAAQIYTTTPPHLIGAATRNVLAHLIDMTQKSLAHCPDTPHPDAIFHPL